MELFKIFGTLALLGADKVNEDLDKTTEKGKETSKSFSETCSAVGKGFVEAGSKIESAGKKLTPASLAVQGLGAYVVKTTADFDAGMSKVAAISGATGDDLQALRDKAREMGAETKFSATEAASAMEYMSMAGWKTEDMLGGIEGVMNLAAASGEDLATTSDIVTDALTAFGLTADDSGHFADILAAASSNANTNVSMMGETFKYAAPIAGSLGYSAEDTAEAIGLMANAGIKGAQAGTTLRTTMTMLQGDLKLSGEKLGDVTIATTNADGTMRDFSDIIDDCRGAFSELSESEQAQAAESLVGREAMSGFLALMNAGEGDVTKLSDAIANCDGTSAEMAATMQDNLSGQVTILMSQLQELAISFGELIIPLLMKAVTWIQGVVDKFNGMDEGTRKVIITVLGFIAAAGPVLVILGKLIGFVGTVINLIPTVVNGVKLVGTGAKALWAILSANPIGVVIAIIGALVAAFLYLWNTNEDFRNFWINLWNGIVEKVGEAKDTVAGILQAIGDKFTSIFEGAKTTVSGAINFIKGLFNFEWHLPHINLPHFSIQGGFSLTPPSVPHLAVDWYAKAMDEPTLFTKPTLFDINPAGTAKGAGEAGDELMYGHGNLMNDIREAVRDGSEGEVMRVLTEILGLLTTWLPVMAHLQMVLDTGVLVGELAPGTDGEMGAIMRYKERGN